MNNVYDANEIFEIVKDNWAEYVTAILPDYPAEFDNSVSNLCTERSKRICRKS